MQKSEFSSDSRERHACIGTLKEGWIIYACPDCDYELWDHWQTGEIKIFNPKQHVQHSGSYFPLEYEQAILRTN